MIDTYTRYADSIRAIAEEAGKKILHIGPPAVIPERKPDRSPVTEADKMANRYIVEALRALTPHISVVAEENTPAENALCQEERLFWLVDPLDGTRGFIKGRSEYTVNIALIHEGKPIGGAVYAPVGDRSYFTATDGKAYSCIGQVQTLLRVRTVPIEGMHVVLSAQHPDKATMEFVSTLDNVFDITHCSSSIKFCMIAAGAADIYPRLGPTMEWDTAAGHALVLAAGGSVSALDGSPLCYGKKDFLNPAFTVRGEVHTP